jgi:RIO-like serine/threonine protein kinase
VKADAGSTPADVEATVLAVLRGFFETNRNQEWMPERLVASYCSSTKPRQVKQALARLTERGVVEQALERPGNPYTLAYRLHDTRDDDVAASATAALEPAVPG